jgi:biotin transport system substrate-specific component
VQVITSADALHGTRQAAGRLWRLAVAAIAASLFTAAAAQISIHVPFSPVPITGQTLAVLLTGAVLGGRAGTLAMICYLGEGAMGLPVFAGGAAGPAVLIGPTAGYLLAFPLAAGVAGLLIDRLHGRYTAAPTILALLFADALVFLGGLLWLASVFHTGLAQAATLGLWAYIPGDLVKVILVAIALPGGRSLLRGRLGGRF